MKKRLSILTATLLFSSLALPLAGQTAIKDPMIPHGETAIYTVKEGEVQYTYREEVSVLKENTRSIYGFTYKTDKETTEVKVERPAMIPFSIHSVTEGNGISIDSSTLVSLNRRLHSNGILVLSFSDLKYTLRGFPFGKGSEDLDIEFISTGEGDEESSSAFSITVRYKETEKVSVNGRIIDCHKLELTMSGSGIMRVLKPFIPKTYFWYSVESPHYLVAYEGGSGFPGSAKQRVEILDYSGWD